MWRAYLGLPRATGSVPTPRAATRASPPPASFHALPDGCPGLGRRRHEPTRNCCTRHADRPRQLRPRADPRPGQRPTTRRAAGRPGTRPAVAQVSANIVDLLGLRPRTLLGRPLAERRRRGTGRGGRAHRSLRRPARAQPGRDRGDVEVAPSPSTRSCTARTRAVAHRARAGDGPASVLVPEHLSGRTRHGHRAQPRGRWPSSTRSPPGRFAS